MSGSSNNHKGTILITGANEGLESGLVSRIISTPGIYTARNADAAPALRSALRSSSLTSSHSHEVVSLELTNLSHVRTVAAAINKRVASGEIPQIRALVLNPGYLEFLRQTWTDDGFDIAFASNYLGHWLLALLLIQRMDAQAGRIVIVGSESHDPHNPKNRASFNQGKWMTFIKECDDHVCDPLARGTWSTTEEDPSFHAPELQRRLDTDPKLSKICVLGVDPGPIATNITRRGPWLIRVLIFRIIVLLISRIVVWLQPNGPIRTIDRGTADILAAALRSDEPVGESPKAMYFYGSRVEEMSAEARDEQKRELLWRETLRYSGLEPGETVLARWK